MSQDVRNVNVISGLECTGKTRLARILANTPELSGVFSTELDEVSNRNWGGKKLLTKTEMVYRNQLARQEVQKALIIHGVKTVLLDMAMLTRAKHQEPLVRILRETEEYLRLTLPERRALENLPPLDTPPVVRLNVILLYCNIDTVKRRLEIRRQNWRTEQSPAFNMEGLFNTALQFEMPVAYTPLSINTSDESPSEEEKRLKEVLAFFLEQRLPAPEIVAGRLEEAAEYLQIMLAAAREVGIVTVSPFTRSYLLGTGGPLR